MATNDALSAENQEFLAKCEEDLKHRFTEKDENFMKVFNAEPSKPPIVESWWVPQNSSYRGDRRHRRYNPYDRHGREPRGRRDHYDGQRSQRPRYH